MRGQVEDLYAQEPEGPARRAQRERLERALRDRVAALDLPGRDAAATAEALRLGDACLALSGTYHGDLALWDAALAALDGDLAAFVRRAQRAAEHSDARGELARSTGRSSGPGGSGGSRGSGGSGGG